MCTSDLISIEFKNIQSISKGKIHIKDKAINIKYGYNGLGKSSLGKAIEYKVNNMEEDFNFLEPYSGGEPSITISKEYKKCNAFNKDYIDQWLFKESNNIIDDSYSIFFNNKDLKVKENNINTLLVDLANTIDNETINEFVNKCNTIGQNMKINKDKRSISGNCTVGKGFKNGPSFMKKVEESDLKEYSKLVAASNSPQWFKWFSDGKNYIIDNKCPYCLNELNEKFSLTQGYIDSILKDNDFKKNNSAKEVVLSLASISDESIRGKITAINEKRERLDKETEEILAVNYLKADVEVNKILKLRQQKKISMESIDKKSILEFYSSNKLNLTYFKTLDSELYNSAEKINLSIDKISSQISELVDAISAFKKELAEATNAVNDEINNFLKYAGIPYKFEIKVLDEETSETIIKPNSVDTDIVDSVERHLSFGELNSFSLALFGAINKRNNSDLIILDDPISSFDENKKFAVMHYLFNPKDGVLKDKTVILLTHDMEPLLDMVRADFINGNSDIKKEIFANLIVNNAGIISEIQITKEDIKSSIMQELELANDESIDEYLRLIHLRRYYELKDISHATNEYKIASSAEHLKPTPSDRRGRAYNSTVVADGINKIVSVIRTFDYTNFVSRYNDRYLLNLYRSSTNNYDKLRLIRPLLDHNRSVAKDIKLWNFITENYHVENMYLYGVCGVKQIPDYIISLCDELIDDLSTYIH